MSLDANPDLQFCARHTDHMGGGQTSADSQSAYSTVEMQPFDKRELQIQVHLLRAGVQEIKVKQDTTSSGFRAKL